MIYIIFGIILTLLIIIGVHELGHFLMARVLNIAVDKFSIGFGKKLISFTDKKNTEYVISAIPLGGYVAFIEEQNSEEKNLSQVFTNQPYWKRFLVIIAGPLANFILALCLYWIIFSIGFISVLPITGSITPNSIAQKAGMQSNMQINTIDNIQVKSWSAVYIRILNHIGKKDNIIITTHPIKKPKKLATHILKLTNWKINDLEPKILTSLGITPWQPSTTKQTEKKLKIPNTMLFKNKYGPIAAFSHAWRNTKDFTLLNIKIISRILTGKISLKALGGPISIFSIAGTAAKQGVIAFMSFLSFLSISIGLINILPIPGLDGGQLLLQTIELIINKPMSPRLNDLLIRLGIICIILITFQAISNDIQRLAL